MLTRSFAFTYPCPRKLREVIKMTMIEKELPKAIQQIWSSYHESRPQNVSSVITSSQYTLLYKRLKESPLFIFPLRRQQGYFFMISQSQENSNLFTFLDDFKKNPSQAIPYFVLTLFDELILTKGISLIRGDIIDQLITKQEAQILLKSFLAYYIETGLYENYVNKFNNDPSKFNHETHVQDFFSRFR